MPFTSSFETQLPDDLKNSANTAGFIRAFLIAVAAIYLAAWAVARYVLHEALPLSFAIGFAVFAIVAFFVRNFLVRANRKRPQIFVASFIGTLAGKLFLTVIILVAAGILDQENFKFTALAYLIGYFVLSAVEIRNLLPLVRRHSP